MSGTFVAVVGRSGAGKDSLIDYARTHFTTEEARFVRRVVTRDADVGSEDHDTLDTQAFLVDMENGRFALSWEAHGLHYGLPVSLNADLAAGRIVVANLSRAIIPVLMQLYPSALVVEVVADADVVARRLAGRARETPETIDARLSRNVTMRLPSSTVQIDNSGPLEIAGERLVALLRDLVKQPAPSALRENG